MRKRILWSWLLLLTALLAVGCDAVRENPAATTETTAQENAQSFVGVSSYGYYADHAHLPDDIKEKLDAFGSLMWLEPSLQTEMYTEIPEAEHNAKGVDPVFVVLPDRDLSGYQGPYLWDDYETGLEICASYRVLAGMLTDELVKVYIDDGGNIQQYETVNLGQYDQLDLNERYLESACVHFESQIQEYLGDITQEFYNSNQHHAPSAYRLFVDTEGDLVLCTTAVLTENAGNVELYAKLKYGKLYE